MTMIYCNLRNHRSATVSEPRLFAESITDASGGFAYAMEHPTQNIPVTPAATVCWHRAVTPKAGLHTPVSVESSRAVLPTRRRMKDLTP